MSNSFSLQYSGVAQNAHTRYTTRGILTAVNNPVHQKSISEIQAEADILKLPGQRSTCNGLQEAPLTGPSLCVQHDVDRSAEHRDLRTSTRQDAHPSESIGKPRRALWQWNNSTVKFEAPISVRRFATAAKFASRTEFPGQFQAGTSWSLPLRQQEHSHSNMMIMSALLPSDLPSNPVVDSLAAQNQAVIASDSVTQYSTTAKRASPSTDITHRTPSVSVLTPEKTTKIKSNKMTTTVPGLRCPIPRCRASFSRRQELYRHICTTNGHREQRSVPDWEKRWGVPKEWKNKLLMCPIEGCEINRKGYGMRKDTAFLKHMREVHGK